MIKKIVSVLMVTIFSSAMCAQEEEFTTQQSVIDSIENSFNYQYGKISLEDNIGEINIPKGFKYLNPEQSKYILVDLWGNPESDNMTLGMILPENYKVIEGKGYVFNIEYDEIGYVKDDDADDIDYDELLEGMQEETIEGNKTRESMGYEPVHLLGWASKPYYDKDRKILHWAKEIKFGTDSINTLNYNVRVLGRKGVLILNAISTMDDIAQVKQDIPQVLNIVEFNDGFKYKDFDPSVDEVAAWTIGGLVAGKVLAKAGFFAIIAKFGKVIFLAIAGFVGVLFKRLRGKKNEDSTDDDQQIEPTPET